MNGHIPVPEETDRIAKMVVDAIFRVHTTLGPGLLESVYQKCLVHELGLRKIKCKEQVEVPIIYDTVRIEAGLRLDVLVEDCIILELKACEQYSPVFEAQLLTYLKLTGHRLGLLINFNVPTIKQGIKRIIL